MSPKFDHKDFVRQIFDQLHNTEYRETVCRYFDQDNHRDGGFASACIAIFGMPRTCPSKVVFTARHYARRCDGEREVGTTFGGPTFCDHAAKTFNEGPNMIWLFRGEPYVRYCEYSKVHALRYLGRPRLRASAVNMLLLPFALIKEVQRLFKPLLARSAMALTRYVKELHMFEFVCLEALFIDGGRIVEIEVLAAGYQRDP